MDIRKTKFKVIKPRFMTNDPSAIDNLLKGRGFHFSQKYRDNNLYVYSFSCYNYNYKPLLFCDVLVRADDLSVSLEVVDGNEVHYAPWYDDKYSTGNKVVEIVNNNIIKKLHSLGIKEVKKK